MAVLLLSLGLISVVQALVISFWGSSTRLIGDPWGLAVVRFGEISVAQRDIWALILSMALLSVFYYIIQHTKSGVAMRAIASDTGAA
jgi:branched-chain amino acid transport system permease protein